MTCEPDGLKFRAWRSLGDILVAVRRVAENFSGQNKYSKSR